MRIQDAGTRRRLPFHIADDAVPACVIELISSDGRLQIPSAEEEFETSTCPYYECPGGHPDGRFCVGKIHCMQRV